MKSENKMPDDGRATGWRRMFELTAICALILTSGVLFLRAHDGEGSFFGHDFGLVATIVVTGFGILYVVMARIDYTFMSHEAHTIADQEKIRAQD